MESMVELGIKSNWLLPVRGTVLQDKNRKSETKDMRKKNEMDCIFVSPLKNLGEMRLATFRNGHQIDKSGAIDKRSS
ncbi:conserved domain protein [delta proteobacterium NaphS2]|nr:conserved domain protein [delta proteobacterium NaphS2]